MVGSRRVVPKPRKKGTPKGGEEGEGAKIRAFFPRASQNLAPCNGKENSESETVHGSSRRFHTFPVNGLRCLYEEHLVSDLAARTLANFSSSLAQLLFFVGLL